MVALFGLFLLYMYVSTTPVFKSNQIKSEKSCCTAPKGYADASLKSELLTLCNAIKFRTLERYLTIFADGRVFIETGDIGDMWIRDSAIQMRNFVHIPKFKPLIEAFIRTQALYLLSDPYANSFRRSWVVPLESEKGLRRGGWVATGNWEPDSVAYFFQFLCDFAEPRMFEDSLVIAAIDETLRVLAVEQNHSTSDYTYDELPNGGKGSPVATTGLIWGGFRPSDDQQTYGYNIPVNVFIHSALSRLLGWYRNGNERITKILSGIESGLSLHGIKNGMYAYEVDGFGNSLLGFDDANVPSLLSLPLLNYTHFDKEVYKKTRAAILSKQNPQFFIGSGIEGIGSPHTPPGHVWPLSIMTRALTSTDSVEIQAQLSYLLSTLCGTASIHESVSTLNLNTCTRTDFEWANSVYVELMQQLFPGSCLLDTFVLNKLKRG